MLPWIISFNIGLSGRRLNVKTQIRLIEHGAILYIIIVSKSVKPCESLLWLLSWLLCREFIMMTIKIYYKSMSMVMKGYTMFSTVMGQCSLSSLLEQYIGRWHIVIIHGLTRRFSGLFAFYSQLSTTFNWR